MQQKYDPTLKNDIVKASKDYIESFRSINGRLPLQKEFDEFKVYGRTFAGLTQMYFDYVCYTHFLIKWLGYSVEEIPWKVYIKNLGNVNDIKIGGKFMNKEEMRVYYTNCILQYDGYTKEQLNNMNLEQLILTWDTVRYTQGDLKRK